MNTNMKISKYLESPEGWHGITKLLEETLVAEGVVVHQIKEKFGGLRCYAHYPDSISDTTLEELEWLMGVAEIACQSTCQICGKQGGEVVVGGWVSVLCDEHAQEKKERMRV